MAGMFGANVMQVLKLLTPNEVSRMVSTQKNRQKVSLTKLMTEDLEDKERESAKLLEEARAKILPFHKKKQDSESEEKALDGEETNSRETKGEEIVEASDQAQAEFKTHKLDIDPNLSSFTEFIISEKERIKDSQKKLKSAEVLQMYQKNHDFESDQNKDGELSATSAKAGLLINKKHY